MAARAAILKIDFLKIISQTACKINFYVKHNANDEVQKILCTVHGYVMISNGAAMVDILYIDFDLFPESIVKTSRNLV